MLAIRLQRAGSKKRPFFRVVVIEAQAARDSRFVDSVGHYDPRTKPERLVVDRGRIDDWVKRGARLSDTVRTLLDRNPPVAAPETPAAAPAGETSTS